MKHAMKENPLYAVSTAAGCPVFPGDVITDFRGDVARFRSVTRGPEENGTAKITYTRDQAHGQGTYDREVYAGVFALVVTLHCPGCGKTVALEACDCCVPGNCAGTCVDCGWVHPLLLGYED